MVAGHPTQPVTIRDCSSTGRQPEDLVPKGTPPPPHRPQGEGVGKEPTHPGEGDSAAPLLVSASRLYQRAAAELFSNSYTVSQSKANRCNFSG